MAFAAGDVIEPTMLPRVAKVTSTQALTLNSTTFQNVTSLVLPVVAGRSYLVELVLLYSAASSSTNPDIKVGFTHPSGGLIVGSMGGTTAGVSTTSSTDMLVARTAWTSGVSSVSFGTGNGNFALIKGSFDCNASGNFQVQAAQNTADNTNATQILSGSLLVLQRYS